MQARSPIWRPGGLSGFHRTLFPLVVNVGFSDNAGGLGGNAAGVPRAVGQTWLFQTPTAVTKEISPAVSMSNPDPVTPMPL